MSDLSLLNEIMYFILLAIAIGSIIVLWVISHDKTTSLSFSDLIATDGKLNERKITRFGAWIVSTWGFVYLIVEDSFTEWYFLGYMGAWVANALIGKALGDREYERDRNTRSGTGFRSEPKPYFQRAKSVPLDGDPEL